jgi:hypothetical protein
MEHTREDIRNMMEKEYMEDCKKVMEFLKKYPMANIMQVYSRTGVSMSRILDMVKNGVLKIREMKAS